MSKKRRLIKMEREITKIESYQEMLRTIMGNCASAYIRSLLQIALYYFEYLKEDMLQLEHT